MEAEDKDESIDLGRREMLMTMGKAAAGGAAAAAVPAAQMKGVQR